MVCVVNGGMEQLRELSHQAFDADDVATIFQPVASSVELFLRSTAFPLSSRHDSFQKLINDLSSVGLSTTAIGLLHEFRNHYNKIKHEPGFTPSLVESKAILKGAHEALVSLVKLAPGRTNLPEDRAFVHQLQVALWDHFTSGDTEVSISLPSDHWTGASTLDVLYIRGQDWDALKADLLSDCRFHLGPDYFAPEVWDFLRREGDFLNAGIWEGSYRDLVRIIAKYEWREINSQLLPGLARENSVVSVGTALVMAGVDVAAAGAPQKRESLIHDILLRVDTEYALSDTKHVRAGAGQIADIILSVPPTQQAMLVGPILRRASQKHDGPLPVLLEEGKIVFEFGTLS